MVDMERNGHSYELLGSNVQGHWRSSGFGAGLFLLCV